MNDVTIRTRDDGLVELAPKLAPMEPLCRWLVIVTVLMTSLGFYAAGLMPPAALLAIAIFCVAGDAFLGAKALLLLLVRPAAEVRVVPGLHPRTR